DQSECGAFPYSTRRRLALGNPGRAPDSQPPEFFPAHTLSCAEARSMRGPTTLVAVELDHVVIAVRDLTGAARAMDATFGLASIEGGRHPGRGTANRIVPLGDAYLELVTVVDEAEAGQSPFGRWVARRAHEGPATWLG